MKKKRRGHYCRICDQWKANEKFSGKGHSAHICKECALLPIAKRNELQRINKIERIAEKFRITKEEWDLLEKYSKNNRYPELMEYAADVLTYHRQIKEDRKPRIEEIAYSDLDDELKEKIDDHFYIDLDFFITRKGFIPEEKHLKRITKGIIDAYIRYSHLRIIPDAVWSEQMRMTLSRVIADLEEDGIVPQPYKVRKLVATENNGKWGFLDAQTDEEVVPFKYDYIHPFSVELALVQLNGWWGYVDKTGKEVIPCIYNSAYSFTTTGLAAVCIEGKCGFIDRTGTVIIPLIYDDTRYFMKDGKAKVKLNGETFFIDVEGNRVG